MNSSSSISVTGKLRTRVIRASRCSVWWKVINFYRLVPALWRIAVARLLRIPTFFGKLSVRLIKKNGPVVDYGVVSLRVVTTAFVEFMVDELQAETAEWGDFKYHDSGVGVTGAAIGDTAIETTDGEARATGTQTENGANVYESVGTINYTTTKAITEHGLFSTIAAATLMDRHVFAAINVVNGDSIQFTYNLTVTAGG
jgi:hypothetical protein